MPRYKLLLARVCWQYMEVEVEADDKTAAVERTKEPSFWAEQNEAWTFPEPDDEIIRPDPDSDDVEEVK